MRIKHNTNINLVQRIILDMPGKLNKTIRYTCSMLHKIKEEYGKLHDDLLKEKRLIRPTDLGYSGSASAEVVFEFFKRIKLDKYSSFLDLGSGDGKVVLVASLFTKSTGIEIDRKLIKTAESIKKRLGIKNAEFIQGDFLDADISSYGIMFINPDQPLYEIEKKLRNEMTGKQRLTVFGGLYKPLNLKLEKEYSIQGVWFGVYKNR